MTIMTAPACAVRAGDTILRHPDHPARDVRYLVIRGASSVGGGILIDYTAPADEVPNLTPNDRASGVLVLEPDQECVIDREDPAVLPVEHAALQAVRSAQDGGRA